MTSLFTSFDILGQQNDLEFRFANGHFYPTDKTYSIDIEAKTSTTEMALYAMNLRFFYEADHLQLKSFSSFKEGYDLVSGQKISLLGAESSASKMFNLKGVAGYINQGIELKNNELPKWKASEWIKLATVNFEVLSEEFTKLPCPSFIWDKQQDIRNGGLLKGSMGATSSYLRLKSNKLQCSSAMCGYQDYNWVMNNSKAPFGIAQKNDCYQSYESKELVEYKIDNVILSQNSPNPFHENTIIEFSLPKTKKVTFSIFDLNGKILHRSSKTYQTGKHTFNIDKSYNLPNGTLIYEVETENYNSEMKKMIKFQ